jgi:hypothetical protein
MVRAAYSRNFETPFSWYNVTYFAPSIPAQIREITSDSVLWLFSSSEDRMPPLLQNKSCQHHECVCDSIIEASHDHCHHMSRAYAVFAEGVRHFIHTSSSYFSKNTCGLERLFREIAQHCNTMIKYCYNPTHLRSAVRYEYFSSLLKEVAVYFMIRYKRSPNVCNCVDCYSNISRSAERNSLLVATSNLIVLASLLMRTMTIQHIKNSMAFKSTTSRKALMEIQLLPICFACSLSVVDHATQCYFNNRVKTCAMIASHTATQLHSHNSQPPVIDWTLPSALCAIHWQLLEVMTTKPEDFYLPDVVIDIEERIISLPKYAQGRNTVRNTDRPTTQELTDCRLSTAISDFNHDIAKHIPGLVWLMETKRVSYDQLDKFNDDIEVKVKICKVGLTVDQLESSSHERNVASLRVFTRYFSARTSTYYPLLGIEIDRGGIVIPNYLESYIIMFILVTLPLIAVCALAIAESFRDATGFTPVESSAAVAAILVFAGEAYFKTREYEIDWGLVVQRQKIAFKLDEYTARDLGVTFDVLMNWIWYNKDSYSDMLSEATTCYLLTDREKTGKTDVPGGLYKDELLYVGLNALWIKDENLREPRRQHIGVEVLPDNTKDYGEDRLCYLTSVSYNGGVHITDTLIPKGWYAWPCTGIAWTFSGASLHVPRSKSKDGTYLADKKSTALKPRLRRLGQTSEITRGITTTS